MKHGNITFEQALYLADNNPFPKTDFDTKEIIEDDKGNKYYPIKNVTSLANSKIKATCKITVKKPTLKISGKSKVKKGKSIQLKATLKNLKGTVKWSVSNSKLAKITKTGKKVKLKAKKTGTVKVTAKVGSVKATKKIKIVK